MLPLHRLRGGLSPGRLPWKVRRRSPNWSPEFPLVPLTATAVRTRDEDLKIGEETRRTANGGGVAPTSATFPSETTAAEDGWAETTKLPTRNLTSSENVLQKRKRGDSIFSHNGVGGIGSALPPRKPGKLGRRREMIVFGHGSTGSDGHCSLKDRHQTSSKCGPRGARGGVRAAGQSSGVPPSRRGSVKRQWVLHKNMEKLKVSGQKMAHHAKSKHAKAEVATLI